MTDQIRSPWTPEQVAALNEFQRAGWMHPFTCGNPHVGPPPTLAARPDGWRCTKIGCSYQQDWAHAFMADPSRWPKPFGERHGPTPEESRAAMLVQVGWYCWRCRAVNRMACRSDNVPVHVPVEWADEMRAEIARREDEDDGDEPAPPQDGPHAPQGGPQHPDAGAETPDGAGGRQTGAGGFEPCRTTQHCAYHGWCHRCDPAFAAVMSRVNVAIQRNDPNDSHWGPLYEAVGQALRGHASTPRSDMGTEFVHQVDHPDKAGLAGWEADLASGDAADNSLRERLATVLSTLTVLGGALPAKLVPVIDWSAGKTTRIADWQPLDTLLDALLAVRDTELERLEKLHQAHLRVEQRLAGQSIAAESAVEQIRLHIAAHRPRLQYADPILLGRLDAVLRQVGELEAAGGGEQA